MVNIENLSLNKRHSMGMKVIRVVTSILMPGQSITDSWMFPSLTIRKEITG